MSGCWVPCPAFSVSLVIVLVLLEPTGNVAPKLTGKKYDGGKIELFASNTSVYMTCDVVGYPVPLYR